MEHCLGLHQASKDNFSIMSFEHEEEEEAEAEVEVEREISRLR